MARLIDADDALRMINNSRTDNPFFNGKTAPIWEKAHDCAMSCVVACPTVDAVPVVHGRWIRYEHGSGIYCSRCRRKRRYKDAHDNYCPNCGADMRERSDGE